MKLHLISTLCLLSAGAAFAEKAPGQHFINSWDADGDGQVTIEEMSAKRENVFASFDADENGVLSAEEYAVFDEARANDQKDNHGEGAKEDKLQAGMTLAFNDVDGNGEVSLEEFLAQAPAWMEMADKNADGVLTTDDFGH